MKITIAVVLLAAVCNAAEDSLKRNKNKENVKTDKRDLVEGNLAIEKRAPVLPTVISPGIEYAETVSQQQGKTPSQQIYSTPVPQIAKISDVLTGQGPPFQTAIASHLYSPVSIYQPRLSSPTRYEVSAPVASQLAYSEHKIYQPAQNSLQYTQQKPTRPATGRLPANPYQSLLVQPQPLLYSQPIPQAIYQHNPQPYQANSQMYQPNPQVYQTSPQVYQPNPQIYQPNPQVYQQFNAPPLHYPQTANAQSYEETPQVNSPVFLSPTQAYQNQPLYRVVQTIQREEPQQLPGIVYVNQEEQPQPQRELKTAQAALQKQFVSPQSNYHGYQGPVSYASYSQVPSLKQNERPQIPVSKAEVSSQALPKPAPAPRPIAYVRPGTFLLHPQYQPPQLYNQHQELVFTNPGFPTQETQATPAFQPIQYFGKFAQSIFNGYQQPQQIN